VVTAPSLDAAYAACLRLAREHYENFPVASHLIPARMRPHIAAIYAFARTADDIADEPGMPDDERLRRLDEWGARLDEAVSGSTQALHGEPACSIFTALANTIRVCHLPVPLFHDLLSAFRQDVVRKRYATWDEVLDYCRRSANPVGRLVLGVAGRLTPALGERSDDVCTALQLTNFWQDIGRDWENGRLYVPESARVAAGAREQDLDAAQLPTAWKRVMTDMVQRTRALFESGRPVCDGVDGRLRWELRLTWLGGSRILDRIEAADYDVVHNRPKLGAADAPLLIWRAARWRAANGRPPSQLPADS
jgi:squalene synthase HpnC